jgi:hypothetical protein
MAIAAVAITPGRSVLSFMSYRPRNGFARPAFF